MVVTGSNLLANSWKTVYSLVSGLMTVGSIYSAYPVVQYGNTINNHLPFTVIDNAEQSQDKISHGQGRDESELNFSITAYSSTRSQLDTMSDEICYGLTASRLVLANSGLFNLNIERGGVGTDIIDDVNRIHFKTVNIGLTFSE